MARRCAAQRRSFPSAGGEGDGGGSRDGSGEGGRGDVTQPKCNLIHSSFLESLNNGGIGRNIFLLWVSDRGVLKWLDIQEVVPVGPPTSPLRPRTARRQRQTARGKRPQETTARQRQLAMAAATRRRRSRLLPSGAWYPSNSGASADSPAAFAAAATMGSASALAEAAAAAAAPIPPINAAVFSLALLSRATMGRRRRRGLPPTGRPSGRRISPPPCLCRRRRPPPPRGRWPSTWRQRRRRALTGRPPRRAARPSRSRPCPLRGTGRVDGRRGGAARRRGRGDAVGGNVRSGGPRFEGGSSSFGGQGTSP